MLDWIETLWYGVVVIATVVVMLFFVTVIGLGLALVCVYFHWVWWLVIPSSAVVILCIGFAVDTVEMAILFG